MGHFVLNDFDAIVRCGEMVTLAIDDLGGACLSEQVSEES